MKIRVPVVFWGISLLLFLAFISFCAPSLPDRVATHFGTSGHANGWMSRSEYLLLFTIFGIGFSSFVIGIGYIIRFFPPTTLNVPKAEYWRSPEHYREACDFMFLHSFWFGVLASNWSAALHYLIVQANRSVPPVLDAAKMGGLTLTFLTGTAVWVSVMIWHFSHPPTGHAHKHEP